MAQNPERVWQGGKELLSDHKVVGCEERLHVEHGALIQVSGGLRARGWHHRQRAADRSSQRTDGGGSVHVDGEGERLLTVTGPGVLQKEKHSRATDF